MRKGQDFSFLLDSSQQDGDAQPMCYRLAQRRKSPPDLGRAWTSIVSLGAFLAIASQVAGQDNPARPAAKLPAPETQTLSTKDFVEVHCVYYPGTAGKKTVPVILLHGWDGPRGSGSGADCQPLALRLHRAGHAVAVPDLRGHGRTTRRRVPGSEDVVLDRNAFRLQDFRDMQLDVEAVKSFLLRQNNEQQLNIELLCVVGFEMGAVVGLNWVRYDWSVPPLRTMKQGQDAKAFVLVSPEQTFRGLHLHEALNDPVIRGELSAMLIYGRQNPDFAAAGRRIFTSLKRFHRQAADKPLGKGQAQDLFLADLDTSLQGTKLLTSAALKVPDQIAEFIRRRLVNRGDEFPWRDRTRP
jgi:pimeloyl-ACP methyl ester carboxylesterase